MHIDDSITSPPTLKSIESGSPFRVRVDWISVVDGGQVRPVSGRGGGAQQGTLSMLLTYSPGLTELHDIWDQSRLLSSVYRCCC